MRDTLYAGAGIVRRVKASMWSSCTRAASNIQRICNFGVQFDKNEQNEEQLAPREEGAHSKNRIVHAGDATGKEVCDKLIHSLMQRNHVKIEERCGRWIFWCRTIPATAYWPTMRNRGVYGILRRNRDLRVRRLRAALLLYDKSGGRHRGWGGDGIPGPAASWPISNSCNFIPLFYTMRK